MPSSNDAGQVLVRRGLRADGSVATCAAGRFVGEDEQGLLMWIDSRSELMRRTDFGPQRTTWHPTGGALVLTSPRAAHSVLWFFDGAGTFTGWYVNLETPIARWPGGYDYRDNVLDVLVAPDLTWRWDDEDEFAGFPDPVEAAAIRAEGESVIAAVEAGRFPFDGTHWPSPQTPPGPQRDCRLGSHSGLPQQDRSACDGGESPIARAGATSRTVAAPLDRSGPPRFQAAAMSVRLCSETRVGSPWTMFG